MVEGFWAFNSFRLGGCQNYGPFLGTLNNRCRIIVGTQKGTIILTTTQMYFEVLVLVLRSSFWDEPFAYRICRSLVLRCRETHPLHRVRALCVRRTRRSTGT